jgi:hypothetical protein
VVERLADMPGGTLGFRCAGEMTLDDYRGIMVPIDEVLQADGRLRMLFEIVDGFKAHDPRVFWADLKADFKLTVAHRENVERTAIVTDVDWLRRWMGLAAWMAPGEAKLFDEGELEAAKSWVAA